MTHSTYSGSCLCGGVHFDVQGRFDAFYLCHCSRCRKGSGTAHCANLFATSAQLNWLAGEDLVRCYTLPGSRHCRSFCTHCGSALPTLAEDHSLLAVPAGCLDSPVDIAPTAHLCTSSRADWDRALEKVTQLDGLPDGN